MAYNKTLAQTYEAMSKLSLLWKEAVNKQMGWKSDNPFYYRIRGQVKCTPAEKEVFIRTLEEIEITKPGDLFPATEDVLVTVE